MRMQRICKSIFGNAYKIAASYFLLLLLLYISNALNPLVQFYSTARWSYPLYRMFLLKLHNLRNEIESECGILVPNELIFQPFYGGASFTFTKHFPSVVKVTWWRWQQVITVLLCRVIVMGGLETRFQYMQLFRWDFFLKILSLYFICFPALQEDIWSPTNNARVPAEHSRWSFWARKAPDPTLQSVLASTSRVKVQGCIFWCLLLYWR